MLGEQRVNDPYSNPILDRFFFSFLFVLNRIHFAKMGGAKPLRCTTSPEVHAPLAATELRTPRVGSTRVARESSAGWGEDVGVALENG